MDGKSEKRPSKIYRHKQRMWKQARLPILVLIMLSIVFLASWNGSCESGEGQEKFIRFCAKATPEQIRQAIKDGADPNIKDKKGRTPILLASYNNTVHSIRVLIDSGAIVNTKDINGTTPLIAAALSGNLEGARLLLNSGAHVNAEDKYGTTALMATIHTDCRAAKLLIKYGADVNIRNRDCFTALMYASGKNTPECVNILIESGAEINAVDVDKFTPLIHCVRDNEKFGISVAKLLLQSGADINIKSIEGKRAIDYAKSKQNSGEMIPLLLLTRRSGGEVAGRNAVKSRGECGAKAMSSTLATGADTWVCPGRHMWGRHPPYR